MEKVTYNVRKFIFRLLGIDYERFFKKLDFVFLRDDVYTKINVKSCENGAIVSRSNTAEIIIGKYCSIAQNVRFIADGGNHMFSAVTSFPLFDNLFEDSELNKLEFRQKFIEKEGIIVGHGVWIGSGAYIMPGVKIGNGATIAANSVATKDVSDYTLVAGSPAKKIKIKHDSETIVKLNKIAWWDWDEKVIKSRIEDFYHKHIQSFVNKYYHE